MCVGGGVCVCACVRVCVRTLICVCVRACVGWGVILTSHIDTGRVKLLAQVTALPATPDE